MIKAIGFICVRLVELFVSVLVATYAPHTALGLMLLLDPLHERWRPEYIDPALDLREFYPAAAS